MIAGPSPDRLQLCEFQRVLRSHKKNDPQIEPGERLPLIRSRPGTALSPREVFEALRNL